LENRLEHEEEYVVNKLRKQLDVLQRDKTALSRKLEEETAYGF